MKNGFVVKLASSCENVREKVRHAVILMFVIKWDQ
jgi:hypothetical protein